MKATTMNELDLELIGQRIVTLAQISVMEHLEALSRSQADALVRLVEDLGMRESTAVGHARDGQ